MTHDLHDEFGWQELTRKTADIYQSLPPADRARSTIITSNYGQAAAINHFGPDLGLPGASTGHMTYFLWGPANPAADIVIAVDLDDRWTRSACLSLSPAGESDHLLSVPSERHVALHICRGLSAPLPTL